MSERVNFGNVANDYAKYRDDLPSIIFKQLKARNVDFVGKEVLDLGSGSGILSRALKRQGANVTGIEPEQKLIKEAIALDHIHGVDVKYICSTAEKLDLPDNSYDIVTALRAWHWFDRKVVNQQVMRLLKKNGYLIVIHSIFVPQLSVVAIETINAIRNMIGNLKPAGSMADVSERRTGLPVIWFDEWQQMGFEHIDEWEYDYSLTFSKEEWLGKVRTLSWLTNESEEQKQKIIHKVKDRIAEFDDILHIPHRYSVVVLKKN